MIRKMLFISMFFLLIGGYLFAQETETVIETEAETEINSETNESFSRHIITADAFMGFSSLITTGYMNLISISNSEDVAFFAAAQYEYQITEMLSAIGRFEYRLIHISDYADMSSICIGGLLRVYPGSDIFFWDGMVGYTNFSMTDMQMSHYLKIGSRIGWRIDFGKSTGFILEPSLGYFLPIGRTNVDFNQGNGSSNSSSYEINSVLNDMYNFLIRWFFVGGPVFSLGMGYRF